MKEIVLSKDVVEIAKAFSENVYETNYYYKQRGQINKKIIIDQILIGKVGEFGVREWLINKGHSCSEVDVSITKNKTFLPDLIIDETIPCHVKSQSMNSAKRFGKSWTFQYAGTQNAGHTDREIFVSYKEEDKVVFCLVSIPKVFICAKIKVAELHRLNLFDLPIKDSLKQYKRVVYYNKIPTDFKIE